MKPSKRTLDVTRTLAGGMSFREYYADAGICPFCRSESGDFKVGDFGTINGDAAVRRDIRCRDCGKQWQDTYKLVAITELPDDYEFDDDDGGGW